MSTHDTPYCGIVVKCRNVSGMDTLSKVVSEIDYAIGDRVETLMRRAGYNKTTLGRVFQLSPSAMSLKLRGQRSWSAVDVSLAAATVGVRVAVLYGEEPMPEPTLPARVTPLDTSKNAANRRAQD